jgi:hypothetical protein
VGGGEGLICCLCCRFRRVRRLVLLLLLLLLLLLDGDSVAGGSEGDEAARIPMIIPHYIKMIYNILHIAYTRAQPPPPSPAVGGVELQARRDVDPADGGGVVAGAQRQ